MPVDMTIPNSILGAYVTGLQMRRQRERDVEEDIQKQKIFDEQMRQFNENLKLHQETQKMQQQHLKLQHDMDIYNIKRAMREDVTKGLRGNISNEMENPWSPGTFTQVGPRLGVSEQIGDETVSIPGNELVTPQEYARTQVNANKPLLEQQKDLATFKTDQDIRRDAAKSAGDIEQALMQQKHDTLMKMYEMQNRRNLEESRAASDYRQAKMTAAAHLEGIRLAHTLGENSDLGGLVGDLADLNTSLEKTPAKYKPAVQSYLRSHGLGFIPDEKSRLSLQAAEQFAPKIQGMLDFTNNYSNSSFGPLKAKGSKALNMISAQDNVRAEDLIHKDIVRYVSAIQNVGGRILKAEIDLAGGGWPKLGNTYEQNFERTIRLGDELAKRFKSSLENLPPDQLVKAWDKFGMNTLPKTVVFKGNPDPKSNLYRNMGFKKPGTYMLDSAKSAKSGELVFNYVSPSIKDVPPQE